MSILWNQNTPTCTYGMARADCAGKNCANLFAFCASICVFMSICICSTVAVFGIYFSRGAGGAREFQRKIIRVVQ